MHWAIGAGTIASPLNRWPHDQMTLRYQIRHAKMVWEEGRMSSRSVAQGAGKSLAYSLVPVNIDVQ